MLWRALEGHDRALRVLEGQRALKGAEGPRRALKSTKGHPKRTHMTSKGHAKGTKNLEGPLLFRLVVSIGRSIFKETGVNPKSRKNLKSLMSPKSTKNFKSHKAVSHRFRV